MKKINKNKRFDTETAKTATKNVILLLLLLFNVLLFNSRYILFANANLQQT